MRKEFLDNGHKLMDTFIGQDEFCDDFFMYSLVAIESMVLPELLFSRERFKGPQDN